MDNQHRKIKTYRELNQTEINDMNSFKEIEKDLMLRIDGIVEEREKQLEYLTSPECFGNEVDGLTLQQVKDSLGSLAIAKTNIEQGLMWAIKGVACPHK